MPTHLECCNVYTYNDPAEHICPTYDGPPCATCGEPTLHCTAGAPGIGSVDICRSNHRNNDTIRTLELWEI